MTRRRWIADQVSGNRAVLVGSHAQHLSRVLRAQVGQEFDVVAEGVARRGRISRIEADRVEFELGSELPASSSLNLTLLISIFKFDRMEWAVEKCTELGVARIVPVIARRTEAHLAAAAAKRRERWQRIARQASEQARRVSVVEVDLPLNLKEAVRAAAGIRVVLAESEEEITLRDAVRHYQPGSEIALAFGPEGGWTEAELELFCGAGWIAASLGDTILRAETAAIAATAVVMAECA